MTGVIKTPEDKTKIVDLVRHIAMVKAYEFEILEFARLGFQVEKCEAARELEKLAVSLNKRLNPSTP